MNVDHSWQPTLEQLNEFNPKAFTPEVFTEPEKFYSPLRIDSFPTKKEELDHCLDIVFEAIENWFKTKTVNYIPFENIKEETENWTYKKYNQLESNEDNPNAWTKGILYIPARETDGRMVTKDQLLTIRKSVAITLLYHLLNRKELNVSYQAFLEKTSIFSEIGSENMEKLLCYKFIIWTQEIKNKD